MKELIEKAVMSLDGQSGSKEDIIAKAEVLYPPLVKDSAMQRSLDQAFSKYLQVQPSRVMLLHCPPPIQEGPPGLMPPQQGFCLKSAVVECLSGAHARSDKSLDLDTLKKLLIESHANKFA